MIKLFSIVLCLASLTRADTIKFLSSGETACSIVQETPDKVTVILGSGLMTVPKSMLREVVKDANATPYVQPTGEGAARIPDWEHIVRILGARRWATDLRQIPATVIDNGVLKNVPYKSFKCGDSYEINVYGDPYQPAGIEIGVYRTGTRDPVAKANCRKFISDMLGNVEDSKVLSALKEEKDEQSRSGLTFEVTPSTAEDAYGGWWISVYDETTLDKVRATNEELQKITLARSSVEKSKPGSVVKPGTSGTSKATGNSTTIDDTVAGMSGWTKEDLGLARVPVKSNSTDNGGPRVYVRGYIRKDGVYVHSYSRRK